MERYLVRRKSDGMYRHIYASRSRWGCRETAQIFKTKAGARQSVYYELYERIYRSEDPRLVSHTIHHPEWLDERFEIVPVRICAIKGGG